MENELKSSLIDDNPSSSTIPERKSIGLEYSKNGEYDTLHESICVSLVR